MALIVAGDRSGVGKTTVTLALLSFLSRRGDLVQSFKVGPDYIDPMFHTAVTNRPCRNLDPVLTSENYIKSCFARHTKQIDWAVVEGVMGLFDGIDNITRSANTSNLNDYGSTAHIARILNLPVLLVLDCSRLSSSIAAIAYGYANLDPRVKIAGVILNQVASDRHLELLQAALKAINLPILGVLRRNEAVNIPDRHLGLIPTAELSQIEEIFSQLAYLGKTCFNWERLLPLLKTSPRINDPLSTIGTRLATVKIAVAKDPAFNFYYQDNLDILTELGAELVFWSPLTAATLPQDISGLYFGGGFPEVFAERLAANQSLLEQLRQAIQSGMPTYAECGGLMYLCQQIIDLNHKTHPVVGIIPTTATMAKRLTLGYRQAIALQDSPVVFATQTVRGHEFHRSQLISLSKQPLWQMQSYNTSNQPLIEGWRSPQLHASYLHLHFGEFRFLPEKFIQCCLNYKS